MSVALAADSGPIAAPSPMQPVPFKEAIAWAKGRRVTLPDVYYGELQGLARAMSFSIAGLAKLDQLQAVKDSLTEALETGETLRDWQKRVKAGAIGLDLPAHRLENIFRTNIQGNYARGRCEQQKRHTDDLPWFMYDAINDSRTRPAHAAMDGKVARHDDPWWDTHSPPNGYSCRCRRIQISDKQAARFQAADAKRMQDPELADARATAKPDKGWDYSVCEEPVRGIIDAKNKRGVSDIVTKAEKATPKKERSKIEMDNLGDVIGLERPDGEEWFVRWSRGINADKKSPNSKDYATGEMHQGLSSVPWPSNESLGKKLKSISEYMFLRLKDPKIRPYIYKAKQIGTDSDGYSLISEISLKAEFSDRFIKMIDKGVAEIIEIVESIESINNRMASVDAIGKSILENSLMRKKKTLADIFALHPDLAEELRAYGIIGLM